MIPFPHAFVQIEGSLLHENPSSIEQVEEQPSPETVFPSSHYSEGVITPSPQTSMHVDKVVFDPPEQLYPGADPVQF